MNVNFGATLDPYDNSGNRINTFNLNNGGSLFRMTSANVTLNYSISVVQKIKKVKTQIHKPPETEDERMIYLGPMLLMTTDKVSLMVAKKKEPM
jgi:hypothetical protein